VELITDKPYNQIPFWMKSADVLVLPNSKKVDEMQSKATSPLKLFEYMASGTPIVASDIPAIREIVNDAEVFFVEPDSPEKLAEKIKEVLSNPKEAERRAGLAKEKVKEFAWIKRAEKIAGFLERKIESVCYFGCYDSNYARNRVLIGGLKKNGCAVVECQSAHKDRKKYFDLWKKFSKNCKNCDVIIVAHPGHGLVWFAKIISRKPIIFDPIYSYYDSYIFDRKLCGEKTLKAKYYHFWDWFCSRIADCVLLECGTLIDYFINEFGLPREKFIKVIMSADDETLKPREKEPSGKFITHFHGTFIPFHGIEYIVKAAKLLENEKDMVFNIIGSGQISKKIDALIKELDVKNINYWGKRIPASEITEQIVKADICLGFFTTGPRAQKVMTNKIFESIAMKKPVITADLPVMREIYRDGENIIFCKGESAEDLAGKILMLKNDENLRAKIALNAYNLFKEKLNPKAVVGQMMDVLEKKI
jgi:glycosyltransferase involved in cell wall biosynthesis